MRDYYTLPGIPSDLMTSPEVDGREIKVGVFDAIGRRAILDFRNLNSANSRTLYTEFTWYEPGLLS